MAEIAFSKMHGLGNDFMVIDNREGRIHLSPEQIRRLAHRHFGVGFDQLLMVEAPSDETVDFNYRIFNADGEEVEQCGNGARCFALFVHRQGLTVNNPVRVRTNSGDLSLRLEGDKVTVDMGVPRLLPSQIPILSEREQTLYQVTVNETDYEFGAVSMGNPHICLMVEDITHPIEETARLLQSQPMFPQGVNVGFMQRLDASHVRLRVYERGAGETLACGSGACAAVVIGRRCGILDERVRVDLPGGSLGVQWGGEGEAVIMTGPAAFVFHGSIDV